MDRCKLAHVNALFFVSTSEMRLFSGAYVTVACNNNSSNDSHNNDESCNVSGDDNDIHDTRARVPRARPPARTHALTHALTPARPPARTHAHASVMRVSR